MAKIIINYKPGNKVNALENPSGYNPSFTPVSQSQKFKHMRQNNANGSSFKPFNNSLHLKGLNKSDMCLDEEKMEYVFNDVMGKITIPIEKLEKLFEKLYPQAPHENTQNMISSIVIAALAMSDPIGYLARQTYLLQQSILQC